MWYSTQTCPAFPLFFPCFCEASSSRVFFTQKSRTNHPQCCGSICPTMLTKFDTNTKRVKGLSFHPVRPWILCSLHNGWVQLWNYRMGVKLDQFEEHEGPVRGVHFHSTEPLFVSGGDDYKIKVWNYKLRRCLFTHTGHLDYIRTVQFHHAQPWIVSSSDDQTVRIWDWKSRECIAVLTGHNHYVMSAQFHPKDNLVVSASLDQTVRVWDTSGLLNGGSRNREDSKDGMAGLSSRLNADLFGGSDAVIKYVLEGHDRGVNWASFHPNLPLIVSGADDNQVKLWRMNETKAWEMDTMRGHSNNVSCAIFHQKMDQDLIISNSEDRSIRVWDVSKRMGVQTFRREHDRFWIVTSHPERNLLAAGHDSGMMVFKLHRERPAFEYYKGRMYYVKDRYLRMLECSSDRDIPIAALNRRSSGSGSPWHSLPKTLYYNKLNNADSNVLVFSNSDGGTYELLTFSKNGSNSSGDCRKGHGYGAVFIARNKFAVLDKNRNILIKNFQNETTKKIPSPVHGVDNIFPAGVAGRMILRKDDKVILYEHTSKRVISDLSALRARRLKWNRDFSRVAILCKHQVILATRDLKLLSVVNETVRVKDGAWDDCDVFIYTTLSHIKYLLPNGDCGIVRSMDEVVYITRIHKGILYCLDRKQNSREIELDSTEYKFKIAVVKENFRYVMKLVKNSKSICGTAIIAYLQKKGYPEIALHLTQDNEVKFELALECGNIEVAMNAAHALNNDECWHKLGVEALRQGNHQVVEMAYQRTKNFERLSFLYLITGNTDKLKKMLKIAEMRNDVMSSCHNALYLGDVGERVRILRSVNQLPLAYILASTHGLEKDAEEIKVALESQNLKVPDVSKMCSQPVLCLPPTPIMREDNWPLLKIESTSRFDPSNIVGAESSDEATIDDIDGDEWSSNGDDEKDVNAESSKIKKARKSGTAGGGAWGADDDLELDSDLDFGSDDENDEGNPSGNNNGSYTAPTSGASQSNIWSRSGSTLAADHVAAGNFDTAMELLNRQIGVVNFEPLKPLFMASSGAVETRISGLPSTPSMKCMVLRNASDRAVSFNESRPRPSKSLKDLVRLLKSGYAAFESGDFDGARKNFESILHSIPLIVVDTRQEANEAKELVGICKEYLIALRLECNRKKCSKTDTKRATELAAYSTHCSLQSSHLVLLLNVAMVWSYKLKNFITAATFARRLMELALPDTPLHVKAEKVLRRSEKQGRNAVKLNYDDQNAFEICVDTLTPIARGADIVRCPYCFAGYKTTYSGKVCTICNLSRVGDETLGLLNYSKSSKSRNMNHLSAQFQMK